MIFLYRVISVAFWYFTLGLGYTFSIDKFDNDWFVHVTRTCCEETDLPYDKFPGPATLVMYIVMTSLWPLIVVRRILEMTGVKPSKKGDD